jgi:hypothetical protein
MQTVSWRKGPILETLAISVLPDFLVFRHSLRCCKLLNYLIIADSHRRSRRFESLPVEQKRGRAAPHLLRPMYAGANIDWHPSRTVGCDLEMKSADSDSNLIWTSLKFRRPYGTRLQTLKPHCFFCPARLSCLGPACLSGNCDTGTRWFPGRGRGVRGEGRSTSSHVLHCRTWGRCIASRMRSWLVLFSLVPGLKNAPEDVPFDGKHLSQVCTSVAVEPARVTPP